MEGTWRSKIFFRFNKKFIEKQTRKVHTDNYASSIIAKSGSNKRKLQELPMEIFNITFKHNIRFDISWTPEKVTSWQTKLVKV